MTSWTVDTEDDLINLDHVEYISLALLAGEEGFGAPEGHTHQILAINTEGESYRLYSGSEDECRDYRNNLISKLVTDLT